MGVHTWRRISSHHPSVSQLCINTKLSGDRCCAHSFVHSCVLRLSMFFRVVPQVEPEDAAVWRLWPVVPRGLHTVSNQAITVWRQVCVTAKKKLWIFHIQNVVTINEEFSGWSLVQLTHQQFWHQNSVYGGVLTQTLESDRIFFLRQVSTFAARPRVRVCWRPDNQPEPLFKVLQNFKIKYFQLLLVG